MSNKDNQFYVYKELYTTEEKILETVKLKWGTSNKKYYMDKGYVFTGYGEYLDVKLKDLSPKSHAKIPVHCKHCGVLNEIIFSNLHVGMEEYACSDCSGIDRRIPVHTVIKAFEELELIPLFSCYTSANELLAYRCKHHNDVIQHIRYYDVRNGHGCKYCAIEHRSELNRVDINVVRKAFIDRGYTPIFSTYVRNNTPLDFICPIHGIQKISYSSLSAGRSCNKCACEALGASRRLSIDYVREVFINQGYTPMFTSYKNANTPIAYMCNKHALMGIQTARVNDVKRGSGCFYCGVDKSYHSKFKRTWLTKGNSTDILIWKYLRKTSSLWRQKSLISSGHKCCLTGDTKYLHVHHLYSYLDLVDLAHKILGFEKRIYYKEYTSNEVSLLEVVMYYLHEKTPLGAVISYRVHKNFHEIYGTLHNTAAQWEDFENLFDAASLNIIEDEIKF